jgi:hypothetical protein
MKRIRLFAAVFSMLLVSISGQGQTVAAAKIYRASAGMVRGFNVWIVDGGAVRQKIYPEFLYGGNDQRYRFVPSNEIWIDHTIAAEEFSYTLEHELCERTLMAEGRMSYACAHDSALALEQKLRHRDSDAAIRHEMSVPKVCPVDCDGTKEIAALSDSIVLKNIYRQYCGTREGISVWIVDGAAVRREIFPDFGFSGNDLAYRFIPQKELWIDGQVSCEETEFSIIGELVERKQMLLGDSYDEAYEKSLRAIASVRKAAAGVIARKAAVKRVTPPDREFGGHSE